MPIYFTSFWVGLAVSVAVASVDAAQLAQAIFTEANHARQENDLPALARDEKLALVAQAHCDDMMTRRFQSHINPEGEDPAARVRRLYPELLGDIGENLLGLEITGGLLDSVSVLAKETVQEWLNSPEHRANLLNRDFTHMAVAVAVRGESYVTTELFSREYIILDKPLPTNAKQDTVLEIGGNVGVGWNPKLLEVFLVLPNPRTEVQISVNTVSVGVAPLNPQVNGNDFMAITVLSYGPGVYRIGFGQKGKVYYPMGDIAVQ